MAKFISKRDESVKLFGNPFMEYMSRAHPATPLIYVPLLIYFAYVGVVEQGPLVALGLFVAGFLGWTLTEYWIHRLLFHYHPRSELGKRVHYWWHGVHHDYPNDSRRLVMPLISSVPLAFLFGGIFWLIAGEYYPALFAGFALGYITYDLTHYAIHHWNLTNPMFRWLKRHHYKHHFNEEAAGYGVSSPLWDYVFRTNYRSSAHPVQRAVAVPSASPATDAPFAASNG